MKLTKNEIETYSQPLALVFPLFCFAVYTIPTIILFVIMIVRDNFWGEFWDVMAWIGLLWGSLATCIGIYFTKIYFLAKRLKNK